MHQALDETVKTYNTRGLYRDDWTLLALEKALMVLRTYTARSRDLMDERVQDAIEFINGHYAQQLTVPDIARAVGLSDWHFTSLFSNATDTTPAQYLERVRLTRASDALRFSHASIGEIATASGYSDPSYFGRRFRRSYGHTPLEYRALSRSTNPTPADE